jgi:hypothetical protein
VRQQLANNHAGVQHARAKHKVQTQINKAQAPVGLVFWKPACFLLLVKLPLFSFYSALNSSHAVARLPKADAMSFSKCSPPGMRMEFLEISTALGLV